MTETLEKDPLSLYRELDVIRREEVAKTFKKKTTASNIADLRWKFASEGIHRLKDGVSRLDFKSHPYQKAIYQDDSMDLVVYGSSQWGKALCDGTLVLTWDRGWVEIQDLRPGDFVVAVDGSKSKVLGVFPQGRLQLYRVDFADGRSIQACAEHMWGICFDNGEYEEISTNAIAESLKFGIRMRVPIPLVAGASRINPLITKVTPTFVGNATCIAIDHPSHLFIAEGFIVTRNTEFLIVDLLISAAYGLSVLMVNSKKEKREKFVRDRLNPALGGVEAYKRMLSSAAHRGADADSTQFKHFGDGSINLLNAESEKDFTSFSADKVQIDEHQECNQINIGLVFDRMAHSYFGQIIRVGHPSIAGTEMNGNLDWLYQQSDRRLWKVPCGDCGEFQNLTWFDHIVEEKREKGNINGLEIRDKAWKPTSNFDIRPICLKCKAPMNRLTEDGFWEAQAPENGDKSHGYKLSNIFNAATRLDKMFGMYKMARHSAAAMQNFYNKWLGEPYDMEGSRVTDSMMAACANGSNGVDRYNFLKSKHFDWRKEAA